jgi:hypothetical protein
MENILSVLFCIIRGIIAYAIIVLPIIFYVKAGSVETYIEGDANILKYILKRCENSPGCSDILVQNGFPDHLTEKDLKDLKKADPNRYDCLINELNIIINHERFLRMKNVNI